MAQQETSVLFSLNEIMRLEDERVKREIEARRRQAEAAERQRLEAERAAREREIATLREQEEKSRRDEARAREEAVRLVAIREAERERAGLEAMRRQAFAAHAEHERRLAAQVGPDTRSWRSGRLVWLSAALFGLVLGGSVLYFGKMRGRTDGTAAQVDAMIASGQADNERMRRTIDEQNQKLEELEARLRAERDRMKTAPPPVETPPKTEKTPQARHPPKPTPAAPRCTCDQHDPLCGCWNTR